MSSDTPTRYVTLQPGCWNRPERVSPAWDHWRLLRYALPYELAALSLGIDPRTIDPDDGYGFTDNATFVKFDFTGRAICQHFSVDASQEVGISEFVHWGNSLGLSLPSELRALGDRPESADCPRYDGPIIAGERADVSGDQLRHRDSTLPNIIGAMLDLIIKGTDDKGGKLLFESQNELINELVDRYSMVCGVSDGMLRKVFADANKSLKAAR